MDSLNKRNQSGKNAFRNTRLKFFFSVLQAGFVKLIRRYLEKSKMYTLGQNTRSNNYKTIDFPTYLL